MAKIATTVDAEITVSAVLREGALNLTVQSAVAYGKKGRRAGASATHSELTEATLAAVQDALARAGSELGEIATARALRAAIAAHEAAARRGEE